MKAYANMGDLEEEPAEILFSNETNEGVQFYGELSPIVENSLSDITIEMKRYGQKVTIAQITIENNKYTGTSEVLFKSIYLANVAEKFGGEACYNLDGYHVDSHLDDLLYRSVDVSLSNGTYLERDYELYGYTTESTCVVLESEMNGKTMYYHFPISVGPNVNAVYEVVICQRGSETPLGDTMIDNYKSGDSTLNIVNYETVMHEVTIGDNSLPDIVIVIRPKGSDE